VPPALAAARAFDRDRAGHQPGRMAEWTTSSIRCGTTSRPPMTEEERAAFAAVAQWLGRLLADGC
jgi:hypothetical protein